MRTLVIIAGVEWNCVNVYKMIPIANEKRKSIRKINYRQI